ncbi:maleylacetate reductase [Gordonia terrae]|uniref:maleylacetate reductase n=1 Tax=Gordonia hongkongensis TaxID=1701090 RepID=UPI0022B504FB|nr:maleylacetate reductase [Gordonia terrae]
MRMQFTHTTLGQRVLFGAGQSAVFVSAELSRLQQRRPLVIATSRHQVEAAHVVEAAGPVQVWGDVVQHVPVGTADAATSAATDAGADVVICIGGGSATGLAKAVALNTGLPVIAVPTTYSGSEATNMWGITTDRTKTTGVDDVVLPTTVIYDADLSIGLPVDVSIASGLNAMAHSVDSLWAPRANPINGALALEAARALNVALRGIVADPGDLASREMALYGCYLSAVAFAGAGSGLHHKICHVLGGTFDLPHAQTHAVVLPHVLQLNAPGAVDVVHRLATALATDDTPHNPESTATAALLALYEAVDAPVRLSDYGFDEAGIPDATDRILRVAPPSNPVHVTADNIGELLAAARAGRPAPALSN